MRSFGPPACLLLALLAAAPPAPAASAAADLLDWVPDRANVALFVDAEAIARTDMAARPDAAAKKGPTYGLESLPPNAARVVVGAQIDPTGGTAWEVTVVAQRKPAGLAELARRTGGTRDTVGGKEVVATEKYGLVAPLAPGVVGAYLPANRQDAGRWLRSAAGRPNLGMSPYLRKAAALVGPQTPVVLAVDTADMVPPARARAALDRAKALEGKKASPDALADLFAGLRGVTLVLRVTDHMTADLRLDFDGPAAALKDVAKPLLLEALEHLGLRGDEMDAWVAAVEGPAVTLRGGLTRETAGRLVGGLLRPAVSSVGGADDPGGAEPGSKAEASVRYYRSITDKLKEMKKGKHATFQAMALSYNTAARQFDDLPILNVDEDLLNWGQSVSATLRTMAIVSQAANGQISFLEANRRMSLVTSPDYFYGTAAGVRTGYWGGAGYGFNYAVPTGTTSQTIIDNYSDINNLQAMTKQQEHQYRLNTWKNMDTATTEVRRKMVKTYGVEF